MRRIVFEGDSWLDYEELREKNKVLHKKLCRLLKEMLRGDPSIGTGKPKQLKGDLEGYWARRISEKDRLLPE